MGILVNLLCGKLDGSLYPLELATVSSRFPPLLYLDFQFLYLVTSADAGIMLGSLLEKDGRQHIATCTLQLCLFLVQFTDSDSCIIRFFLVSERLPEQSLPLLKISG